MTINEKTTHNDVILAARELLVRSFRECQSRKDLNACNRFFGTYSRASEWVGLPGRGGTRATLPTHEPDT